MSRPPHPYADLPAEAYWRNCQSGGDFLAEHLYRPGFELDASTRIATAGSCFAQHFRRYLGGSAGYLDVEPAPPGLPPTEAQRFGYGLFSARYGNIYTPAQLRQLVQDTETLAVHRDAIWHRDGRAYDALRPTVEPEGLESAEEVVYHRRHHLERVRRMLAETEVLVFTLGLTECWTSRLSGRVYPVCPGVVAGHHDPELHAFENSGYPRVMQELTELRRLLKGLNPDIRLLLTVSPVPLVATAAGQHVLVATTYSKSVLRAAAGDMAGAFPDVAYFPAYELVTGSPFGARFAEDGRSVRPEVVEQVFGVLFAAHPGLAPAAPTRRVAAAPSEGEGDALLCDERLVEAFLP